MREVYSYRVRDKRTNTVVKTFGATVSDETKARKFAINKGLDRYRVEILYVGTDPQILKLESELKKL